MKFIIMCYLFTTLITTFGLWVLHKENVDGCQRTTFLKSVAEMMLRMSGDFSLLALIVVFLVPVLNLIASILWIIYITGYCKFNRMW